MAASPLPVGLLRRVGYACLLMIAEQSNGGAVLLFHEVHFHVHPRTLAEHHVAIYLGLYALGSGSRVTALKGCRRRNADLCGQENVDLRLALDGGTCAPGTVPVSVILTRIVPPQSTGSQP